MSSSPPEFSTIMSSTESFVLLGISLFVIGTRSGYRWHQVGFGEFQLDDYVMPISGIVSAVLTFLAYSVGQKYHGLSNGFMTEEQRATLDLNSEEVLMRTMGSKIQVLGWTLYATELWLIKVCITAFYARLFTRINNLALQVKIAYIMIGVSYVIVSASVLLGCQPFHANWQMRPSPGPLCQPTNSPLNVISVYVFNVLTDLYLLSIPLPLLWQVNISLRRKLTLMLLFGGAVFVIAAATVRAVLVLTAGPEGALFASQWGCREVFVSIVVANLPVIQPMLRKLASRTGLGMLFSTPGNRSAHCDQVDQGADRVARGKNHSVVRPARQPRNQGLLANRGRFSTLPSRSASQRGASGPARACEDLEGGAAVSAAAWASDERILMSELGDAPNVGCVSCGTTGEMTIMVGKEVRVRSECVDLESQSISMSSVHSRSDEGYEKKDDKAK